MANEVANKNQKPATLQSMVTSAGIRERFNDVLGKKAPAFISSLISVANNSDMLAKADPTTVITAGIMAATLDLPINQNLGFAYIVPFYNGKKRITEAQFQMGYKGYVQLAMRTGQYKTINASEIYEGEIKSRNRLTGEFELGERTSDKVVGYIAYFRLVNGFEKYLYMTKEEVEAHAKKYSQTYKKGFGLWITDFDSMAIKTVLKRLLSKYGILSVEMHNMATALSNDGAVIRDKDGQLTPDFEGTTVDVQAEVADTIEHNANSEELDIPAFVDPETGEVIDDVALFGD
ncbi:recombinase RecT [Veillonella caviae]|uniref:recombinase RecT n=1 Tax=Veillonella caviae TaxID=248316 RepID=UPI0023F0017E|nr:recombinase RecT [Veillonella caviae]MCI6407294.1 recombinase RecT [Veillonella caviae]MDY6226000.1 recombinase RecT [Veillonella caviae]